MLRRLFHLTVLCTLLSTQAMATVFDNRTSAKAAPQASTDWMADAVAWLQKYIAQNPAIADAICQKFPQYEAICRMTVGDTKAQAQALRICQGLFMPDSVNRCIQVVGHNSFNQSSVRFCSGFFMPDEKIQCLEQVRNEMFQPEALNVCSGLFMADEKLNCVNTVRRKVYLPVELNTCKSMFMADAKIQCLSSMGTRIGNQ